MPQSLSRRETIERLLEHLPDYESPPGRGGVGDGDGLPPLMPKSYRHPSVRELYRCLDLLRETPTLNGDVAGRTVHAHLVSYYKSEWRVVRPSPKRRTIRGRVEIIEAKPTTWRRERVDKLVSQGGWVVDAHVKRGVAFIGEAFRGEPYLPEELLFVA